MGQNKQSVKSFFVNNYHYIVLILFVLTNLFINFRLGIATDDLWFRKASVCSPSVMLQYFQWHYHKENGRLLAHILTVLFLRNKATFWIWKILMVFSLFAYCIIISKLSAKNKSQYKSAVVITVFLFMTVITDIYTGSVYWLTGSFNYFFPVLLLLCIMLLTVKKPQSFLLPILSLFCGVSMEQTGLMTIGWFVLVIADSLIRKRKVGINTIICVISSCLGYATVFFSPATNTRVSNQGFQGFSEVLINILKIIRRNWIDNISLMFLMTLIVISVCFWLYKFRSKNSFFSKITVPVIVYLITFNVLNYIFKLALYACDAFLGKDISFPSSVNITIAVFWGLYMVILAVSLIYTVIRLYIEKKEFLVCAATILGLGSQIMMAASNFAPKRTCFSGITMFMFFVIYSLNEMYKDIIASKKVGRVKVKPHSLKIAVCFVCLFACVYQLVFFRVFGYMYVDFDSKEYHPISSEEMTEETYQKELRNYNFYSNPDSVWNQNYDILDFSLYS